MSITSPDYAHIANIATLKFYLREEKLSLDKIYILLKAISMTVASFY